MPELPEVETTLRGIGPCVIAQPVTDVIIRQHRLRWPIPRGLKNNLCNQTLRGLARRGKYILFHFDNGTLLLHLGMSGRLRILSEPAAAGKHDHADIHFAGRHILRFTDPRRFGALLWTTENPFQHPLLADMGPEPLTPDFHGQYLWAQARGRKAPVKAYIMDSKTVAGVGNIYATEALFHSGIRPQTAAGKVSLAQYQKLADAIKNVLENAVRKGGTTLKDFMQSDGSPGYFSIELQAYGRAGEPCVHCETTLKLIRTGQRSSVYCPVCQK
ncbi:bifunctional DNA-formamidopyrimidine glycosylase/DNA-(apurinic or apyrimidinic site) lyase [Aquicella siphonis]|nr:bifunctional DNA-formamidopyrimidine glycosylase/DNA-(apurinic or apyrimidinic site) lyase [Aquicella siphonis]